MTKIQILTSGTSKSNAENKYMQVILQNLPVAMTVLSTIGLKKKSPLSLNKNLIEKYLQNLRKLHYRSVIQYGFNKEKW